MIEFKAECGHTVRAKDDSAGGVVRCSYCGREATVPEQQGDELDFLFKDIEQGDDSGEVVRGRKRRRGKRSSVGGLVRRRREGEFDPFAIVLKLCYAAFLIAVIIVVGRKFVLPLFQDGGLTGRITEHKPRIREGAEKRPKTAPDQSAGRGLITQGKLNGLYIASTPPGATAYYVKVSEAPTTGRIAAKRGSKRATLESCEQVGANTTYVVEVVFPLNAPSLKGYRGYREFRRAIEEGPVEKRRQRLEDFFLPDGASDVFIDQTDEQLLIVRQYRDVQVRDGKSRGVLALFLPKILAADGRSFAIEEIVADYIPARRTFAFDEDDVRDELDFYGVASSDQPFVLEALGRIGAIPYLTPDGRTRLLRIGIHRGDITARVIGESGR